VCVCVLHVPHRRDNLALNAATLRAPFFAFADPSSNLGGHYDNICGVHYYNYIINGRALIPGHPISNVYVIN
jgi:hypothetical protein